MSNLEFEVREIDLKAIELYRDFLPEQVFDAHMHLYRADTIPLALTSEDCVFVRKCALVEDYYQDMKPLLPGADTIRLNMIPMPDPIMNDPGNGTREKANEHILGQCLKHKGCVASPYVLPGDSEKDIYAMADNPGVRGLKCYCYGAGKKEIEQLAIEEFLPESAWVVANERRIPIILHMMKKHALSDPENASYIERMAHRYPDAQLVLAHCARAFASWTGVEAIKRLEDCGNIWFDLSAICESGPMMACIMKNAGKRTMWGSDYPVCMHRGRAISLANGTDWLLGERFRGAERTYVAVENLLAFHQAALLLNLDKTQIRDLFYYNACTLFGLQRNVNGTDK